MEALQCDLIHGDKILVAVLRGSVDHHTVRSVREEIDRALSRYMPRETVLDLSHVEFMDSSGLGLILGRYAKIHDLGCNLTLRGVSGEIMKIVKLAGIDKFIPVESEKKGGAAS